MAPAKDGKKSGGRSITDFFSPWVRRAPAPAANPEPAPVPATNNSTSGSSIEGADDGEDDDGDVIVVKQPGAKDTSGTPQKRGPGRPRKNANSQSPKSSASGTPQKRGPGRPRKSPSESQDSTPQKRGPGRPRKSESQQMRDNQLRPSVSNDNDNNSAHSTPRKYNINPLDGKADVTPTKGSPLRSSGETPGKRRIVAAVEVFSPREKDRTVKGEEMGNMLARSTGGAGGAEEAEHDGMEVDDTGDVVPGAFEDERRQQTAVSVDETPQETAVNPPKTTAPPASFSSISTLTTLPNSSAATATPNPLNSSTSSRRVTQDGLKGVTNSDSEDDSSSSDEEDPF